MKKSLFFAVAATVLSGCASDELVDVSVPNTGTSHSDIRFTISQKNTTRGYSDLNKTGHYNFGVFAYKSTDMVNSVMPNYLVGYYDEANGYQQAGTTVGDGDGLVDGLSYWMYEGMGSAEYTGTYAGQAITAAYTSNNVNQYLKYWDNAAATTAFYAYAPYINGSGTVTYVDGVAQTDKTGNDTYVMTFPNGTIEAKMVEDGEAPDMAEYMYAYNKVDKANYGHDVALQFHRLNAKVNIKFWEDVPGYTVRILDLGNGYEGVQAAASVKNPDFPSAASAAPYNTLTFGDYGYAGGKFYSKNGVKISFATATPAIKQFVGTEQTNTTPLVFTAPADAKIGETRFTAATSPSTYYAIPKGQVSALLAGTSTDFSDTGTAEDAVYGVTGLTFHVSYELTAKDTGERIVVKNATVHVPYEYCNWKDNTHYTYIFKITENSNGSTDPADDSTIDPTNPEVPTDQSLYPIVFDNCTVLDWEEIESEWEITEGTDGNYHNITLAEGGAAKYSYTAAAHTITVSVADGDNHDGHAIAYNAYDAANAANGGIAVTDPSGANVTTSMYAAGTGSGTITLSTATAAGVYTVTYYCPDTDINTSHAKTWTQTFFVGDEYTVTTHHDVIGTKFTETEAYLTIATTKNAGAEAAAGTSGDLYIEYPDNFKTPYFTTAQLAEMKDAVQVSSDKSKVVVKKNALPGDYKLVYKITEGTKEVKVDEHIFTVKDYTLTLSPSVVYNYGSDMTVTGNQAASSDNVYTTTVGSASGNVITVPTATTDNTEGTVTYTVWNGASDVAKTTYTATFKVYDTHAVAVDKATIDRNLGTSTVGAYTTDNIVITTTHNGVATTDVSSSLSIVKSDKTATTAGDFTITYTSANKCDLKVKNNVAPGNYYVKYVSTVGGADKAEYVGFVVTE